MHVREDRLHRVELVRHPEVSKGHVGERGDHDPQEDGHHPPPLLVLHRLGRVEEEESVEDDEAEGAGEGWQVDVVGEQEEEQRGRPGEP